MTLQQKLKRAREQRQMAAISAQSLPDAQAATVPTLFPAWKSGEAVAVGDRRYYEPADTLYRCLTAHTSQEGWTPDASPSLWVRIDDPAVLWPEWVQPLGSTDAYPAGAQVSWGGKHWISDLDANIWEPGVSGWTEAV